MAILSSTKSRHGASSSPQVPLVIISQPLPGPITGQNSLAPQVRPDSANQSSAAELLLEVNHASSEPEEASTCMTSLPVADDEPIREEVLVSFFFVFQNKTFTSCVLMTRGVLQEVDTVPQGAEREPGETFRECWTFVCAWRRVDSFTCLFGAALGEDEQKELERRRRRELYKEKRFFCELCDKGFHQKHQLRKHVSCHVKPFPCTSCDKGFYKARTLQKHQLTHQLREAQENDPDHLLRCDQCDRKFRLLRQLRVHQASHRLEKTPLQCRACERTFTSASALRYHEVSHSQVKPFMCDVCGKGFTRKKSLREHQTIHTGARPYPCLTCGKRFSTASNLRVHKRSHSDERPYKCCECDKAFKCKMGLLQHRVVHSGEKPFMCQTCGLSFGLKYNFQRHLRLHNGEKPFRYRNRFPKIQLDLEGLDQE